MKLITVIVLVTVPGSILSMSEELAEAYQKGALSKIVYRVVDDRGFIVSNALAHIWYRSYGRQMDNADWVTQSDDQGVFVAEHRTNERLSVLVGKENYYCARDAKSYFDAERNSVSNGRWLPYGVTNTIVLKRILAPGRMNASVGLDYHGFPPLGRWTGFDLQKRDWVAPIGQGERPDVLLRFVKKEFVSGYVKTMEVAFTNNLHAGAYLMKADINSDMRTLYRANSNAVYRNVLVFDAQRDSKGLHRRELADGQYLVFRTRTNVDAEGQLMSAHYGCILGNWRFCEKGGMAIERIVFNPTPNDTNLEDVETARRSRRAYKQILDFETKRTAAEK